MFQRVMAYPPARALQWLGFYIAILAAWCGMYVMVRGDGNWLCGGATVRLLPFGGFWAFFPMWAVMIAAMMLPALVPTLRTYDDLPERAGATGAGWFGVVVGYVAIWLVGSAGFAGAQVIALNSGQIELTGIVSSPWMAAALFILAGTYQFSRTKQICQDACLTPMQYFIGHWRPGFGGGVRMGAGLGVFCIGCCWAIMALAFVGGVMSLLWMGLATSFMVLEKLPEIGRFVRRPAGAVLLGAGVFMMLRAAGWI